MKGHCPQGRTAPQRQGRRLQAVRLACSRGLNIAGCAEASRPPHSARHREPCQPNARCPRPRFLWRLRPLSPNLRSRTKPKPHLVQRSALRPTSTSHVHAAHRTHCPALAGPSDPRHCFLRERADPFHCRHCSKNRQVEPPNPTHLAALRTLSSARRPRVVKAPPQTTGPHPPLPQANSAAPEHPWLSNCARAG